jgi:hypothetical protein
LEDLQWPVAGQRAGDDDFPALKANRVGQLFAFVKSETREKRAKVKADNYDGRKVSLKVKSESCRTLILKHRKSVPFVPVSPPDVLRREKGSYE